MKIAVCVKWVPVVSRMKFDAETRRVVREGVPNELNAYDVLAVQRAVELKESHGAEVTVYTMGPPNARDGLVRCLAMGADHAFHIMDVALAGSDTLATARVLAQAMRREPYDLMLFGHASVDAETGQVGPEVAEMLGGPQVTAVTKLEIIDGGARLERLQDEGTEVVEATLPALITVTEGVAPEIFPGRDEIKAADQREIPVLSAADLGLPAEVLGQAGSPTWVAEIRILESAREQRVLEEVSPADAASEVAAYLAERGALDPARRAERHTHTPASPQPRGTDGPQTWVVAETGISGLRPITFELLAAAQPIADAVGGPVMAVLLTGGDIDAQAAELCAAGADSVLVAEDAELRVYSTEAHTATLAEAVVERAPYAVLLPSTSNGRDLAGRLAGRLELGLTGDAVGFEVDGEGRLVMLKPAFGGNVVAPILSKTQPNLATVRPGLFDRLDAEPARPVSIDHLVVVMPGRRAVRSIETRPNDGADAAALDTADVVICVGMGVGGPEGIRELEELRGLLGAQLICTRDVVEAGWMPQQLQVGLTGRSIGPALYIGVGVRGDFNHTVGIQRAGTVVGINNNRRASIFRQADIGVMADWREFVPELVRALREAGA